MKVNLGSGTHYANGWLNLDVRSDHHTLADEIVDGDAPLAGFEDGTVDQVYLGHVLEHVPWPNVVPLLREVKRVLSPVGRALAVSPDVYKLLDLWKHGQVHWDAVTGTIEHADRGSIEWPEAVHHWNCHEARVTRAFEDAEFRTIVHLDQPPAGWPVVGWSASWQCCVQVWA